MAWKWQLRVQTGTTEGQVLNLQQRISSIWRINQNMISLMFLKISSQFLKKPFML